MDQNLIAQQVIEGLVFAGLISVIPLSVAMVVGILLAILQSATQIQEQTLTFLPKLIAVGFILLILIPYLGQELVEYTEGILNQIR
ncbi:MAG: flagellar biosynthetic protein FliQ [Deltaproteobacteria bacterium]|nr:flagellar biosynthetic protein FliQ [Deltaproteobacteria bacterium]